MVDGFGFGYGTWSQIMLQWEQYGVFTILLPLVLVFTVVFAILERINLFKNKGVHMVIGLVIGFFTVANPYVSSFFMYLFSNLALGIAILVVAVILLGLTIKPGAESLGTIFVAIGIVLLLVVLGRPLYPGGPSGFRYLVGETAWYWILRNIPLVIILAVLAFVFWAILKMPEKKEKKYVAVEER